MAKNTVAGPERIQEDLLPLAVDINDPILDPRNAREHPEENLDQIKLSLLRYGQCKPVVVNRRTGIIEAGNGMVQAARELGWKRIAVSRADHSEQDAMGYGLMDNKSGLSSTWNLPNLKDVLESLDTGDFDMRFTGFSEKEIEDLMTQVHVGGGAGPGTTPGALMERFIAPPFSVLDSRQGYWQDRKQQWINLGIKSELGRGDVQSSLASAYRVKVAAQRNQAVKPGEVVEVPSWAVTSIFDPVLCELMYAWFTPPGGKVLDPFAGGSVRGIVASYLGRQYTGIDLSAAQVEENRRQALAIAPANNAPVQVTVSGKWARHAFRCDPDYIVGSCKGRCCEGSDKILISLTPDEEAWHKANGYAVKDGLLQPSPETGVCPHKTADGLCGLHGTPNKPFGCIASPFTLNSAGTLIIRHRYSMLKCHNAAGGQPAYLTFKESLRIIFGPVEADRIIAELEAGAEDVPATMPASSYRKLVYLDGLKHADRAGDGMPTWIVGDSRNLDSLLPAGEMYDLIFTCPPYFDLEVYSDNPADLCNADDYQTFLRDFGGIIKDCAARLKPNRFAGIVVADVRDKAGFYRNLVADTIKLCEAAGLRLYNDAVLINVVGTASIRANNVMKYRKLVKTHQNVLVFYKGDPRAIRQEFPPVEVAEFAESEAVETGASVEDEAQ